SYKSSNYLISKSPNYLIFKFPNYLIFKLSNHDPIATQGIFQIGDQDLSIMEDRSGQCGIHITLLKYINKMLYIACSTRCDQRNMDLLIDFFQQTIVKSILCPVMIH